MARRRRRLAEANEAAVTGASKTHLEALNLLEELRSRQCLISFLDSWLDPFPSENGTSRLEYVEEWCNRRTTDARDARDAQLARDRAQRVEERDAQETTPTRSSASELGFIWQRCDEATTGLLKSGPDGHELSPDKAERVCELFESLFSVKAWWELHCRMTSYVEASGFCKAETQEESDRRDSIVWTSYHSSRHDNSKGDVEDDEPRFELDHSPDEADHLMRILHEVLEARKYELGLPEPHTEIAHTSMLLKQLVAPLLGFRVADKNFHKLFSNTLFNGKSVYTLTRHLGPGAIAFVTKRILRNIGAKLLNQSLPQLTRDHPSLKICLDTVNENFLDPLSQGKQLDYERVGTFLRIRSKDQLFNSCEEHEDGLSGLFSSEDSLTERNFEPESGSLGVGTTNALTGDVEETCTNRRPECDEDEEPVFDIRELLAEEGRRDGTTQSSGTRDDNRTRAASGRGDGPTTPPSTAQKRQRRKAPRSVEDEVASVENQFQL
ncbi:MAG: hypothetical protein Q9171_007068 [Xanthocarpia ochracea]